MSGDEAFNPGSNVRPEYLKLPGDLVALARSFGIELPDQYLRDAVVLTFSIECLDRLLDAIEASGERARFSAGVMDYLQGRRPGGVCYFTEELFGWLSRLREVVERHQIAQRFYQIVDELLDNSEQMRTERTATGFVNCALREGRLMVELLLLIIGEFTTTRFNDFIRRLSEPANLIDKLRDARRDYAAGELALKPGLWFRLCLSCEMFRRVFCLARFCVGNRRLLAWGFRSLVAEVKLV